MTFPTVDDLRNQPEFYVHAEISGLVWYPWEGHLWYIHHATGQPCRCAPAETVEKFEAGYALKQGYVIKAYRKEEPRG